jgi:hypothetical protein
MRHIAGDVTRQLRQLVEILAPLLGDGAGIVEIVFVQLLDKGCVAAKEEGVTKKLIHHGSYLSSPFWFELRKPVAGKPQHEKRAATACRPLDPSA